MTPVPEVITLPRRRDQQFLVLATDGLFDELGNERVVALVRRHLDYQAARRRGGTTPPRSPMQYKMLYK